MSNLPKVLLPLSAFKFVVDSNVWIDAAISDDRKYKDVCNKAIERAKNEGIIIDTRGTFYDLVNAIHKKLNKNELKVRDADKIFEKYKKIVERTDEPTKFTQYAKIHSKELSKCPDKDDHMFLALAHQQGASYIITNDQKHLVSMGEYMGVKIITPKDFLKETLSAYREPDTALKMAASPGASPADERKSLIAEARRKLSGDGTFPVITDAMEGRMYSGEIIAAGTAYVVQKVDEGRGIIHNLQHLKDFTRVINESDVPFLEIAYDREMNGSVGARDGGCHGQKAGVRR
jgi:predicted nucleic acid-binding protein